MDDDIVVPDPIGLHHLEKDCLQAPDRMPAAQSWVTQGWVRGSNPGWMTFWSPRPVAPIISPMAP